MTEEVPLRKAVRILPVLIFALSLSAQLSTGDVQGKVLNKEGKPLSGVKVTLSRPLAAAAKTVTGASGVYRFPSVFPGFGYSVKAELVDFKTATRTGIVVALGATSAIDLVLEPGKPEEQVTQTAASPTIDRGKMTTGAHFGWAELQVLPTARDPWAIIQLVPAVLLDRENVGGNESGQQASVVAKGDMDNGAGNVWTVDGVNVTDPSILGASAINFDFDAIDEIAVTTGGAADVAMQTGGIALNLVTRRGSNKLGGTARFYLTDNAFQSNNLSDALKKKGVYNTNKIQQVKDFGANAGGPVVKDHLWLWGAYGVQDLFAYTISNYRDQTLFSNYSFKLDARPFAGNLFEVLYASSSKERFGENAWAAKPEGDHQSSRYRLGSPIFKLQDDQTIGNDFFASIKFSTNRTGVRSRPMVDEDLSDPVVWDIENGVYVPYSSSYSRSWDSSTVSKAKKNFELTGILFKESLFGMSHEFKGGLDFSDKRVSSESGYLQNFEVFRNFVEPMIDLGEGLVVPPSDWQYFQISRDSRNLALASQASGFLQDTISKGRFTLTLGLRYDRQRPSTGAYSITAVLPYSGVWKGLFDSYAMGALDSYLPSLSVKAIKSRYQWSTWSPRIGLSWDIRGDGRTVAKLALSQYGDILAAGANTPQPLGLTGSLGFWWNDTNADGIIGLQEMYWRYSSVHPDTPNQLYALFDANSDPTTEAYNALVGGFESDAYLAGNYRDYDFWNSEAVNYDNLTTFYRSDVDPNAKNVKTSPRTREIMLGLERELRPDMTASATVTFRRYDNFDWAKLFYPADIYPSTPDLVIDNTGTWYTIAGTIPETVTIGETEFSLGDAAGKPWYLPVVSFPGETPYRMVDKSTSFRTYLGLDLAFTKRLSNRWFLNASVTLQDQRTHWGDSYIDPTNKWAFDGKPYGNWASGAGGKTSVQMYSRWIVKLSGLYQLPWGITASATLLAREGWKIPTYLTLAYAGDEAWSGLYKSNTVYVQAPTKDGLPVFRNLSLRLEKSFVLGTGKMVLMADVFNALNSATVNRAYDAYYGVYYVDTEESVANPYNGLYNEILNPRIWRFGVRFEF
jgi:Carboxypeptidase regulatory-like domain